jgi:hypothetical protein
MRVKMGLDAVFYDRSNKREVRSSQLCEVRVGVPLVAANPHDPPDKFEFHNPVDEYDHPLMWSHNLILGEVGYRSDKCSEFMNFDTYTMLSDLVFLRFEELPIEPLPKSKETP